MTPEETEDQEENVDFALPQNTQPIVGTDVQSFEELIFTDARDAFTKMFEEYDDDVMDRLAARIRQSCTLDSACATSRILLATLDDILAYRKSLMRADYIAAEQYLTRVINNADALKLGDKLEGMCPTTLPFMTAQLRARLLQKANV
jgi:hypothetical protein